MVDLIIGILLLVLAAASVYSHNLFGSLALFVAFGMLMALAWARLDAPDLALAEAAIGAGLSGALLFTALQKVRPSGRRDSRPHRISASVLALLIFALLLYALTPTLNGPSTVPQLIRAELPRSGVDYEVTAVLLNFRAWDTVLEMAVLLMAVLGFRALRPTGTETPPPWPLLAAWSRVLAPVVLLTGAYLLWHGAFAPGGAFQAGALIAAGAVLLRLGHLLPPLRWSLAPVRAALYACLILFLSVAACTAWLGDGWLTYPAPYAKALITAIEVSATLSVAAALTLLVVEEGDELQS
ncbi:hydrogenase subunit MbhD domain-containing protein [Gilvimarinus sp. F26214L]|uniref:hydrogenase subunit MbhD domain-containing protein n=1 Tax=Gilvimarinus sp. DZF01 TaxID=3461371 RepID=UPI00404554E3